MEPDDFREAPLSLFERDLTSIGGRSDPCSGSAKRILGTAEGLVSGLACPTGFPEGGRKGFELCPITSAATRGVLRNADSTVTARSETLGTKEFLAPKGVRT